MCVCVPRVLIRGHQVFGGCSGMLPLFWGLHPCSEVVGFGVDQNFSVTATTLAEAVCSRQKRMLSVLLLKLFKVVFQAELSWWCV